ncbi:MAG TPA: SulP family inorganic anion transporter [Nevskiaceae bacterium]|nr:SulP family inorganic anion transporter [Nevskiaceae bacterium]
MKPPLAAADTAPRWAGDALAGTLTAVLLLPQALAYAVLAGLPAEVGLYTSLLPVLIYALTGSSRRLAVGPVAVAALMVGAAITPVAGSDPAARVQAAVMLSALVGVLLLAMGALRLGWISHFISHPVLAGFISGAALLIVIGQLPALLGLSVAAQASSLQRLSELAQALAPGGSGPAPATALLGLSVLGLLLLSRHRAAAGLARLGAPPGVAVWWNRLLPLLLVLAVLLPSPLSEALGRLSIATIGRLPSGLPVLALPPLRLDWLPALLPSAVLIALVAYVESLSVAQTLALRQRERIDPDQELRALGLANLGGALSGAMPAAGGLARSMANEAAGARSQAASVVTTAWVALAALFFAEGLAGLPQALLAALIVMAVLPLVDLASLRRHWRFDRGDGASQALTLVGVVVLGPEPGLLLGAGVAILCFLHRTSRPHVAVVGRLAGSEHYRNVQRYAVQTWPSLLLIRVDESLYFANAPRIQAAVSAAVAAHPQARHLVLIASSIGHLDSSGLDLLERLDEDLARAGLTLHLAEVRGPVMDALAGTELWQRLGEGRRHTSAEAAVQRLLDPETTPDPARPVG